MASCTPGSNCWLTIITAADVVAQQQHAPFSALDSRTLELHLCSNLLLPYQEAHPGSHHDQGIGGQGSNHVPDHHSYTQEPSPGTPSSAPANALPETPAFSEAQEYKTER